MHCSEYRAFLASTNFEFRKLDHVQNFLAYIGFPQTHSVFIEAIRMWLSETLRILLSSHLRATHQQHIQLDSSD